MVRTHWCSQSASWLSISSCFTRSLCLKLVFLRRGQIGTSSGCQTSAIGACLPVGASLLQLSLFAPLLASVKQRTIPSGPSTCFVCGSKLLLLCGTTKTSISTSFSWLRCSEKTQSLIKRLEKLSMKSLTYLIRVSWTLTKIKPLSIKTETLLNRSCERHLWMRQITLNLSWLQKKEKSMKDKITILTFFKGWSTQWGKWLRIRMPHTSATDSVDQLEWENPYP